MNLAHERRQDDVPLYSMLPETARYSGGVRQAAGDDAGPQGGRCLQGGGLRAMWRAVQTIPQEA